MTRPSDLPASVPPHPQPADAEPWGFSRPQRLAFALLLALLLAFLSAQYLRRPALLESPVTQITLPRRIDPNTASALELTRIPNLADSLARKIIDYREAHLPLAADQIVFHQPEDLLHIPGLKQKTLDQFLPYLDFPPTPEDSSTQP